MNTSVAQIIPTKEQKFERESGAFLAQAENYKVVDAESYTRSIALGRSCKVFIEGVKDFMDPHIDRANKAHKALTGERKRILDPVLKAIKFYNTQGEKYTAEIEQMRLKEQAEIAVQNRLRAEEDRKLMEEKLLSEAQAAEEAGEKDLAEAIINKPVEPTTPPPPPPLARSAVPQIPGVSYTTAYRAELVDPKTVDTSMLTIPSVRDALEAAAKKMAITTDGQPVRGFKITPFKRQVNRKI